MTSNDGLLTNAEKKRNERGQSGTFVPKRDNGSSEACYPPLVEAAPRRVARRGAGQNGAPKGSFDRNRNTQKKR